MIFFNQVLFVGFFATLLQILSTWDFIGTQSLLFLVATFSIGIAYAMNRRGLFNISKRVFILAIYALGLYTSFLLGGSGLYHLGVIINFTFGLILFDMRKEKMEIIMGIPFLIACLLIGELGLGDAPNFSNHPSIQMARYSNIFSLAAVTSILVIFIIRLNYKTEEELTKTLGIKDKLVKELEQSRSKLEIAVEDRTKEIEEQKDVLLKQNDEKELLLKEVHHRVKNNLQVIASLINLQLAKINEDTTLEALNETRLRVLSMALVHTKMYQTNDFKQITIQSYCDQLVDNIKELYGISTVNYKLEIPEMVKLDMEKTIPVGLIINEIISNYFKHVHNNGNGDYFEIKIADHSPTHYQVKYKDNGNGFKDNLNAELSKTLGMQLIESLVEQVDGELELYNDSGAVYAFTILKN